MGNSKQKIIEKLKCIPDDLSEEENFPYRKQWKKYRS